MGASNPGDNLLREELWNRWSANRQREYSSVVAGDQQQRDAEEGPGWRECLLERGDNERRDCDLG